MDEAHFYRRVHGVMLVFDLYNRRSLQSVGEWVKQVEKYARQDVCIVLVGNKSDLDYRSARGGVPPEGLGREAQQLARRYGLAYCTTSARTDEGIDFAFVSLLDEMLSKRDPDRYPAMRPLRPRGGLVRCVQCCLPAPRAAPRSGKIDEFALSAREREANRSRRPPPRRPGPGCSVM